MARRDVFTAIKRRGEGKEVPMVFCKLFSDMVTEHLCLVRRQELNTRGGFSCEGCSMEKGSCEGKAAMGSPPPP